MMRESVCVEKGCEMVEASENKCRLCFSLDREIWSVSPVTTRKSVHPALTWDV
jgi:hypothetical protein